MQILRGVPNSNVGTDGHNLSTYFTLYFIFVNYFYLIEFILLNRKIIRILHKRSRIGKIKKMKIIFQLELVHAEQSQFLCQIKLAHGDKYKQRELKRGVFKSEVL